MHVSSFFAVLFVSLPAALSALPAAKWDPFTRWATDNGIKIHTALRFKEVSNEEGTTRFFTEVGVFAHERIEPGTNLIAVPNRLWITREYVSSLPIGNYINSKFPIFFEDNSLEDVILALYLINCRYVKQEKCFHYHYVSTIPGSPTHPLAGLKSKLHLALETHFVHDRVVLKERSLYDSIYRELATKLFPTNPKMFPEDKFNADSFAWAISVVKSRKQPIYPQDPASLSALIPVLDLVRHRGGSPYLEGDENNRIVATQQEALEAGKELTIDAGIQSVLGHYLRFGKTPGDVYHTDHFSGNALLRESHIRDAKLALLRRLNIPSTVHFSLTGKLHKGTMRFYRVDAANSTAELALVERSHGHETGDDAFETTAAKHMGASIVSALSSRPSITEDLALLRDPELLDPFERELVKLRRLENLALYNTLLETGHEIPKNLWYHHNFMTGAVPITPLGNPKMDD